MKKTQNVREGTRKGASRRKKELALALCVSLWIAGGGVASASSRLYLDVDNNDALSQDGERPGDATVSNSGKTLTITGGTSWNDWLFKGGQANSHDVEGYTLNLSGVKGTFTAEGGNANNTVSGNTVEGTNIETNDGAIRGGISYNNQAYSNTVLLKNSTVGAVSGSVGWTGANNSSVTLENTTVNDSVYGGSTYTGTATGNTVTLKNSTITNSIYGGFNQASATKVVTGNTLNISGVNSAATVQNFATININSATWGTSALTLTGTGIIQNADGTWADIDTRNIAFTGINALPAKGEHTILIKNSMTNYPTANIKSGKFTVGTTLQGTGTASIADGDDDGNNDDLIYTVNGAADENGGLTVQEQTHNTVMGAEVGMAALSMGNDFIGAATEGLSLASNIGADGVSSFAQMGGGSMRQETGSHIDSHTWNAILALGHANKKARGTFEYGAFFEYGSGNYTTFAEGGLRGDGSARYTGGGLLAKYTTKNNVYVEGSLRAGSIHDDARNVLRDGAGNPYSYETNAPYMGFHLGVGKEIPLANGNVMDVYGKYFYNRRNSVDFNAGGHYDLDAVTSSVIRLGARYIVKRDKWNFYAGAAYEHELDGKANGTADGVAIRDADTSGGSFRGEIGATMTPGEDSPWKLDLNVTGFAGKKQGFTGGVSVAFMF